MKSNHFFHSLIAGSIFFGILSAPCHAAQKNPPKGGDQVLRDTWYTMTLNGKIPYGYYNEKVELRKGRMFVQVHVWKKEEDFINEEQLGTFAENDDTLTPLFFNFHSTYRSTETTIDGTVQAGKLSVQIKKGTQELPLVKRSIPAKTFLAQFFPVWLEKQIPILKAGKSVAFSAIVEDNLDLNFAPVHGRVKLETPDEFAKSTGTLKLSIMFHDLPSIWWIDEKGTAVRIKMTDTNTIAEKTTQEKAQNSLK